LSLAARAGDNGFFEARAPGGMSALLTAFLGGLQRYVPELFVLFAPNVNSYKRFAPDCIAPHTNSWGINNKTVAFRVVNADAGHCRVEIRVAGADANPYLALAAAVAAGRAGIAQALAPSAACAGDASAPGAPAGAPFPRELRAAVAAWRASPFAHESFGAAFVDAYARSREWQLHQFDAAITDWELQTYARNV
jgi:glutamine synthetase